MKIQKPQNWSTAVKVAYARMQGATQEAAAAAYGITRVTVQNWESSDFWQDVLREADDVFADQAMAKARRTILQALDEGELATAKWVLSKMQVLDKIKERQDAKASGDVSVESVTAKLWQIAHDTTVPAGARAQALTVLLKDLRGEPVDVGVSPTEVLQELRDLLNVQ
jgi:hypothetical protein